ncbi:MAG: GrpB family protein [Candidatus Woesearchaeota archaeon]
MKNLKKYSFNKYSDRYSRLFYTEKNRLRKILIKAYIEHVGSSAVIGLGGKGIIDIAVSVPKKDISRSIRTLQENGYEYKPKAGDFDRYFFQRIIVHSTKERRVHIQLTHKNSSAWQSMIAVREYLRKHRDTAKDYEKIKKEAIIYAKGDGKRYRKYKKSFLKKIEILALK